MVNQFYELERSQFRPYKWWYIRASTVGFAISSYFTIPKSYFINYIILFYNTPNIPKLYFFLILFKYSFLFFFLLFFSLPFLLFLPQPLAPATTKQTITTTPPLPSAQQNPTGTKNPKKKKKQNKTHQVPTTNPANP